MEAKFALKNEGPGVIALQIFTDGKHIDTRRVAVGESTFAAVTADQTFKIVEAPDVAHGR